MLLKRKKISKFAYAYLFSDSHSLKYNGILSYDSVYTVIKHPHIPSLQAMNNQMLLALS